MKQRASYSESLSNRVIEMSLYFQQPYRDSFRLPLSVIEKFYESEAFKKWKQARDAETKLKVMTIEGLNRIAKILSDMGNVRG